VEIEVQIEAVVMVIEALKEILEVEVLIEAVIGQDQNCLKRHAQNVESHVRFLLDHQVINQYIAGIALISEATEMGPSDTKEISTVRQVLVIEEIEKCSLLFVIHAVRNVRFLLDHQVTSQFIAAIVLQIKAAAIEMTDMVISKKDLKVQLN
jgi:hypothetical protein